MVGVGERWICQKSFFFFFLSTFPHYLFQLSLLSIHNFIYFPVKRMPFSCSFPIFIVSTFRLSRWQKVALLAFGYPRARIQKHTWHQSSSSFRSPAHPSLPLSLNQETQFQLIPKKASFFLHTMCNIYVYNAHTRQSSGCIMRRWSAKGPHPPSPAMKWTHIPVDARAKGFFH